MFSDEITTTDAFLDMPKGSQLLYFHLGMEADDDGFISSPKMVMRVIGSSDDELKILYAKNFLIPFESGVCVVKHWRINNQLRKDRYTETKYRDEKASLYLKKNGAYTLRAEAGIPMPMGHYIEAGNQLATKRQPSIGKVSIGKESIYTDAFEKFWEKYPRKVSKKTASKSWGKIKMTDTVLDQIMTALGKCCQTEQWTKNNGQFIPHPATWLNQERWNDEVKIAGAQKSNSKFDNLKTETL